MGQFSQMLKGAAYLSHGASSRLRNTAWDGANAQEAPWWVSVVVAGVAMNVSSGMSLRPAAAEKSSARSAL